MRVRVTADASTPHVELPAGWTGELDDDWADELIALGLAEEAPPEPAAPAAPPKRRRGG